MSAFRIKYTLRGGTGLFTSPQIDSLELAVRRAEHLERRDKATIVRIAGAEGYFFLDREACAELLRASYQVADNSTAVPAVWRLPKKLRRPRSPYYGNDKFIMLQSCRSPLKEQSRNRHQQLAVEPTQRNLIRKIFIFLQSGPLQIWLNIKA